MASDFNNMNRPVVTTIKDRCRVCYTCVRECPAKAIRIVEGQAEVIPERCIGCGNCVRVCSQKAKQITSSIEDVQSLIQSGRKIAACVAPSFAAEFHEMSYSRLVGMIRALGFHYVNEVAFGADLVADRVSRLLSENSGQGYISTACPAVFGYVKRYHPELIEALAPVVSPMVATARALRHLIDPKLKIVFIGPCISKKVEAWSQELNGEIDSVLTFEELRQMFSTKGLREEEITPSDFDPPHAGKGALFPMNRGMLQAAGIHEDLIAGDIVTAGGRANFIDAVMEFGAGDIKARFLDVLCCDGCIMGAGMTINAPLFRRQAWVSQYVHERMRQIDPDTWKKSMESCNALDLSRTFIPYDQRIPTPSEKTLRAILKKMGKSKPEDELNCGACGYDTCRQHAIAIHKGLAEDEMCLPYTIEKLHDTIHQLNDSNSQLATTREALIESEKMASMGQLAAGIAHEVNNPLGVVLMYSHLLKENIPDDDVSEDLEMIVDHAERAKKIVAGLLHFARQNKVNYTTTDVHALIERTLKSIRIPENIRIHKKFNCPDPAAELDQDQMIQVLTNLINNSLAAMPEGGRLILESGETGNSIEFSVTDTGSGIDKNNISKIFEPFFTTKTEGGGTGLGLSIAYGIVKMHRGSISVHSNANPSKGDTGTRFTVRLPKQKNVQETEKEATYGQE